MSEDRKIIEYDGVKYYKKESKWYQLTPNRSDKISADFKAKKGIKIYLPQENLLDVFKFLDFSQLLSFQHSSFYFKNIIDKYGKELARKKFAKLKFRPIYGFDLAKHKFAEIQPHLYDFELSEQLEQKWIRGIEEQIPTFLTTIQYNTNAIVCELQQNYRGKKALYHIKLPNLPKNLELMAIARYLFKLLFNCAFELFEIDMFLINPQMIQLLFDEATTNFPLQIHSQRAELDYVWNNDSSNFIWKHLFSNQLKFDRFACWEKESMVVLLKILTNGGNKFLSFTFDKVHTNLYNLIIKHLETSKDITKTVKEIKFENMFGPRILNEREENIETFKVQYLELANKHNPKIKFSVYIEEEDEENYLVIIDAEIERI
uniref:F-box domain-containing protein n=1 Tax=Meloidogyne incognita TaxID=6306 RepID=A0A914KN35_MELIC